MIGNLKGRVEQLESDARTGDAEFMLEGGARASIKRRDLLQALHEAATGQNTFRARVLLHAVSAKDNSHIHELAQAMQDGPAPASITVD